jgi:hypothetical protein
LKRENLRKHCQDLYKPARAEQLGSLLSLYREIAGARDILQKFENLKKQHEWNFNL